MHPSSGRSRFADILRAAALAGAVLSAALGNWSGAVRFALVCLVLVALRWVAAPAATQVAFAAAALFATVANVLDWYKFISWIDTLIHSLTTSTGAALASAALIPLVVGRAGSARPSVLIRWLFTTGLGAIAAILWEFYEWTYEQIDPHSMTVGYPDTLADLAAGLAGSAVAGLILGWWESSRSKKTPHA